MKEDMKKFYHGMEVVISKPALCYRDVKRSWMERIFSLPFKPLTKYKKEEFLQDTLEDNQIVSHNGRLIMNEKTWQRVSQLI